MKILYLDLEDTVITPAINGWCSVTFLERELARIHRLIAEQSYDAFAIFSFAVHRDKDYDEFRVFIEPTLRKALGIANGFVEIPKVYDDIIPTIAKRRGMHPSYVTLSDIVEFYGKNESFRLYTTARWPSTAGEPCEVHLVDDSVERESFHSYKHNVRGEVFNISELK